MSKLTEIFEQIKNSLHYGPAVEPFHRAVILAHEELQQAHDELKAEFEALKERLDNIFPVFKPSEREYIAPAPQPTASVVLDAHNVIDLSAPLPDHGASITDDEQDPAGDEPQASIGAEDEPAQNPAEPGIKPDSVSLPVTPEPVSAGPDAAAPAASDSTTDQPQGE